MSTSEIPRFWCPRTAEYALDGRGYLLDPLDTPYGRLLNPEVAATTDILDSSCTVLLGEPGAGKSTEAQEIRQLLSNAAEQDDVIQFHELGKYGDGRWLTEDIFRAQQVELWRAGKSRLHLLLDGLDECHLLVKQLPVILGDELLALPQDRLHLIVTCRAADWPPGLERRLLQIFGEVSVLELLPLRRIDVAAAVRQSQVEPDDFLAAVERVGAVPLAIKPLTLGLLVRLYTQTGTLPAEQAELYRRGLLALCDEPPESFRRDTAMLGTLSPDQRMAVAGRLAAMTVLSGRNVLWIASQAEPPPATDLAIGRCAGDEELQGTSSFSVNEQALLEVTRTGLFNSRGPNRVGWAHQSYAEFLAAWYLTRRDLGAKQLTSLLALDAGDAVLPQLRSLAAWLAALAPRQLDALAANDPQAFVGLGVQVADRELKRQIVDGLLRLAAEGRLRRRWGVSYAHLQHDGLAEQLLPMLEDASHPDDARHLAIDIAESTGLSILEHPLASIALDTQQSSRLRVAASYAIGDWGSDAVRARLRPLAEGEAGPDYDDELKGAALRALWPRLLPSPEAFKLLTPPKNPDLAGAYSSFLVGIMPEGLQPEHLPDALLWVASVVASAPGREDEVHHFDPLLNAVASLSWSHLDQPGVLAGLADLVLWRARRNEGFLTGYGVDTPAPQETDKRRALLLAVLDASESPAEHVYELMASRVGLAQRDDFLWLLDLCSGQAGGQRRDALKQLARWTFVPENLEHSEAVLTLDPESDLRKDTFAHWIDPVEIGSEQAEAARELVHRPSPAEESERGLSEDELRERLAALLRAAGSQDQDAWWRLNLWMTVAPHSTRFGDEVQADITSLPGWRLLPVGEEHLVLRAASAYLLERTVLTPDAADSAIDVERIYRPALAGYRAAALLLREDETALDLLSPERWGEWAGAFLEYPAAEQDRVRVALLSRAFEAAPESVLEAMRVRIRRGSAARRGLMGARMLPGFWNGRIADALLHLLQQEDLLDPLFGDVLHVLLEHGHQPTQAWAFDVIRDVATTAPEGDWPRQPVSWQPRSRMPGRMSGRQCKARQRSGRSSSCEWLRMIGHSVTASPTKPYGICSSGCANSSRQRRTLRSLGTMWCPLERI